MNFESKLTKVAKYFDGLQSIGDKDKYPYVLFPLTDYNPPVLPEFIDDIADLIVDKVDFKDIEVLVSQADRGGGPLTFAVAKRLNIPFSLANWYPRESQGQILVENANSTTGPGFICINGINHGSKVGIIYDLISTGGSTLALAQAVIKAGAEIKVIVSFAENINYNGFQKIEDFIGVKPISILKYKVVEGYTKVVL